MRFTCSFSSSTFASVLAASLVTLSCSSSAPTGPTALAGGSTAATERRVDAVRGDTGVGRPNAFVTLRTASGDTLVLHCAVGTAPPPVSQCSVTSGTGRLEGATVFELRFALQRLSDNEMRLTSELLIPQLGGNVYAIAGDLVGGTETSSTPECVSLNNVELTGTLEQLGRVTVTYAYCAAP